VLHYFGDTHGGDDRKYLTVYYDLCHLVSKIMLRVSIVVGQIRYGSSPSFPTWSLRRVRPFFLLFKVAKVQCFMLLRFTSLHKRFMGDNWGA
jgi:hypothetical protein